MYIIIIKTVKCENCAKKSLEKDSWLVEEKFENERKLLYNLRRPNGYFLTAEQQS